MCIYALHEYIDYYRSRYTNVYVTFLDASKAFDNINHWLPFDKLRKREMPCYIVRIMVYWYRAQTMYVQCASCESSSFKVTNGVRQGGIMSPKLFIVYLDGLSDQLNNSNIGCHFHRGQLINHISFFCRVLHTMFSHLRAHDFARSVTVAMSSAVQASSSRRQESRWAIVCGSPQPKSTDWASSR